MSQTLLDGGIQEIVEVLTPDETGAISVVNPSAATVTGIVESLESPAERRVEILARDSVLKAVTGDFIVASAIADLEAANILELRTGVENAENTMMVTEDRVVALIAVGRSVAGLSTDDRDFVTRVNDKTQEQWARGASFSHRTPPLERVQETLSTEIGEDVWEDFDGMLSALGTARGDGDGLDEVAISLLVAARNGILLYDISKWGEDVGLASKATFSRTKTRLEDAGLIDTEKVPIEVGRPRLRLVLGDDGLKQAPLDELANSSIARLAPE